MIFIVCFFKQKTAYEMRISDWSSDVCSSDLGESFAPEKSDNFTLGTSNLWASLPVDSVTTFPETPWALPFSDEYHIDEEKSDWQWETGFGNMNTITEAEKIRDHNLRAVYGNWSYLKHNKPEKYGTRELAWVAYIGGKRESRRLMGEERKRVGRKGVGQ